MALRGRHLVLRFIALWCGVALLALLVVPARAFFPPVPVHVPKPPKPPIHVPPPPVITPPPVTPPGGGGTPPPGGGGTPPPGGGGTPPPETSPEPASLVLALLGGAGMSLFVACRRSRQKRGEDRTRLLP